jgi:hypothetical protein
MSLASISNAETVFDRLTPALFLALSFLVGAAVVGALA